MNSNTAVIDELEHEDIIYDYSDSYIPDEQDEKGEDNQLKVVNTDDDHNVEIDQEEIEPDAEENEFEKLDTLIEELPDHFPAAAEIIRDEIAPKLANCDPGVVDHYISTIKKRTKAESKRSVTLIIDEAIKQNNSQVLEMDEEAPDDTPPDPEITALAEQIAQDPLLFKNKIDLINKFGVISERKNIGLNFLVMDSCLLPMGVAGSEALAIKNSGHYGAGKSFPLFMCLKLYHKNAYHLITSGSDKSLYNIDGGLKNKALVLAEAPALENSGRGDNELAYAIRSLVSEGRLKYQYTGFRNKEKVTIVKKMEGPTSLLTTTIKGKLEDQLEDRLITMHPNTSAEQTQNIIERTAELASGNLETVDEKTISAWKVFCKNLESVEVVIPFAKDISDYITRNGSLPISVRRSFKRVLSATKTITLIYQNQRSRDEMGRVISEISDYSIAFQLIGDAFRESLGEGKRYTDERVKIIGKHGKLTPKGLADVAGVSVAAISPWTKQWVEKGVLIWCDEFGDEFPDIKSLEKAKRSGKAFIRVTGLNRLPTPFELTGDKSWDVDGELFKMYDFAFGEDQVESETLEDKFDENIASIDSSEPVTDMVETKNNKNDGEAVKLLNEKARVKNKLEMIKNQIPDPKDDAVTDMLFKEFETILSDENSNLSDKSTVLVEPKNNSTVDGILTI